MLDLIFFTPGTGEPDIKKVKKLKEKILKSFWDSEVCTKEILLYDESKRQFHILIGEHCPNDLSLEIEVETVYEHKEDKHRFEN